MGTPARVEEAGNTRRALTAVSAAGPVQHAAAPAGNFDARGVGMSCLKNREHDANTPSYGPQTSREHPL